MKSVRANKLTRQTQQINNDHLDRKEATKKFLIRGQLTEANKALRFFSEGGVIFKLLNLLVLFLWQYVKWWQKSGFHIMLTENTKGWLHSTVISKKHFFFYHLTFSFQGLSKFLNIVMPFIYFKFLSCKNRESRESKTKKGDYTNELLINWIFKMKWTTAGSY